MAETTVKAQTTEVVGITQMKDIYHTFEVLGNEKGGWYICWKNNSDIEMGRSVPYFIGSNNNVRHWKKKELAERHAQRLRDGVSKISTA